MIKILKVSILSALLIVLQFEVSAQQKWTKDQKERLKSADIYYEITDYRRALKAYKRLYKYNPEDQELNYKMGVCSFYLNDSKGEAMEYFSIAKKNGSYDALFFIGQCYHLKENFDMAYKSFEEYKAYAGDKEFTDDQINYHLGFIDHAKAMMKNPVKARIYNIGDKVNSKHPDYGPLISADESVMIFTSRREGSTGNKIDPYGKYFEDIYIAQNENGKFVNTQNIGIPINTTTHDAAVGLSADGNTLIIYKTNRAQTGGDLYHSTLKDKVWSKPKKYGEMINSEFQEPSATLAPDKSVMYFSSNRPGGFGGKDIYRTVRLGNGNWSLPLNLGSTVNTPYDEDGPFIHPDGKTLFFSSKGHKSMGGYDIFKTTFENDYWSLPENMGYPINSVGNDIYFVLTANGKRGYYSSYNEKDSSNHDIYVVSFEGEVESLKIVKGKVVDKGSKKPVSAKITLINGQGDVEGMYSSNDLTGQYLILLKPDIGYKMTIEAPGYSLHTEGISFGGGKTIKEIVKEIQLEPIK